MVNLGLFFYRLLHLLLAGRTFFLVTFSFFWITGEWSVFTNYISQPFYMMAILSLPVGILVYIAYVLFFKAVELRYWRRNDANIIRWTMGLDFVDHISRKFGKKEEDKKLSQMLLHPPGGLKKGGEEFQRRILWLDSSVHGLGGIVAGIFFGALSIGTLSAAYLAHFLFFDELDWHLFRVFAYGMGCIFVWLKLDLFLYVMRIEVERLYEIARKHFAEHHKKDYQKFFKS